MRFHLPGITIGLGIGMILWLPACMSSALQPVAPAGSSAAQSNAAIPSRSKKYPSWMKFSAPAGKRATGTAFEPYVATTNTNEGSGSFVIQYGNHDPSGSQVCALPGPDTDYIGGVAMDASANLYVPQSAGSGTNIDVYEPHCGTLLSTLTNPVGNQPQDVAVDGSTTYEIDGSYRDPQIEVFANGATSPTSTLQDSSIYQSFFLAADSAHDVFLSYYNSVAGNDSVIEFPGGTAPGTILPMTGGDGVVVDNANNLLYVVPNGSAWQVQVYAPPYTNAPSETIAIKGIAGRGSVPYCALNRHATRLLCGDGLYETLDVYKYPSGAYIYSILLPYSPYSLTYSIVDARTP